MQQTLYFNKLAEFPQLTNSVDDMGNASVFLRRHAACAALLRTRGSAAMLAHTRRLLSASIQSSLNRHAQRSQILHFNLHLHLYLFVFLLLIIKLTQIPK